MNKNYCIWNVYENKNELVIWVKNEIAKNNYVELIKKTSRTYRNEK